MAYMAAAPAMSVSQAEGISPSLSILISVQGTTPKNSCRLVQHWMAVASYSLAAIHSSITTPSLAILVSAAGGILLTLA